MADARRILSERRIAIDFLAEKKLSLWRRNLHFGKKTRVSAEQLVSFTRQLALLLRAGIHLIDALEMLGQRDKKLPLAGILQSVAAEVRAGRFLCEAMELHPNVFNETYRNLVRAGEASGDLAVVLESIASARGRELRSKTRAVSALIYPVTVLVVALLAIMFLTGRVIPRFQNVIQGDGSTMAMPTVTRVVMSFCQFIRTQQLRIFFSLIAIPLAIALWAKTERGRKLCSAAILRIPLLGKLILRQNLVLFFRTFGSVLGHGVPFSESLRLSCRAVSNAALRNYFEIITIRAGEGVPLGELLAQTATIPASVRGLIAVGERSGTLAVMATYAADILEEELGNAVDRVSAILQPATILILAGAVAIVAAAMFLPMTQMIQLRSI
ncbi:MAG: type II secretion system F family protein [Puniceicoccales bacterium]|nr:type II secretion system F family protein [Puniceicoccales bacterium]